MISEAWYLLQLPFFKEELQEETIKARRAKALGLVLLYSYTEAKFHRCSCGPQTCTHLICCDWGKQLSAVGT